MSSPDDFVYEIGLELQSIYAAIQGVDTALELLRTDINELKWILEEMLRLQALSAFKAGTITKEDFEEIVSFFGIKRGAV